MKTFSTVTYIDALTSSISGRFASKLRQSSLNACAARLACFWMAPRLSFHATWQKPRTPLLLFLRP